MKLKSRDGSKLRSCSGIFSRIYYFGSKAFHREEYIVIAAEAKEGSDVLKLRNASGVPVCAGSSVVQTGRVFKKALTQSLLSGWTGGFFFTLAINALTLSRGAFKMMRLVTKQTTLK